MSLWSFHTHHLWSEDHELKFPNCVIFLWPDHRPDWWQVTMIVQGWCQRLFWHHSWAVIVSPYLVVKGHFQCLCVTADLCVTCRKINEHGVVDWTTLAVLTVLSCASCPIVTPHLVSGSLTPQCPESLTLNRFNILFTSFFVFFSFFMWIGSWFIHYSRTESFSLKIVLLTAAILWEKKMVSLRHSSSAFIFRWATVGFMVLEWVISMFDFFDHVKWHFVARTYLWSLFTLFPQFFKV